MGYVSSQEGNPLSIFEDRFCMTYFGQKVQRYQTLNESTNPRCWKSPHGKLLLEEKSKLSSSQGDVGNHPPGHLALGGAITQHRHECWCSQKQLRECWLLKKWGSTNTMHHFVIRKNSQHSFCWKPLGEAGLASWLSFVRLRRCSTCFMNRSEELCIQDMIWVKAKGQGYGNYYKGPNMQTCQRTYVYPSDFSDFCVQLA